MRNKIRTFRCPVESVMIHVIESGHHWAHGTIELMEHDIYQPNSSSAAGSSFSSGDFPGISDSFSLHGSSSVP